MNKEQKFGLTKLTLICVTIVFIVFMVVHHNPSSVNMSMETLGVSASMNCTFNNQDGIKQ